MTSRWREGSRLATPWQPAIIAPITVDNPGAADFARRRGTGTIRRGSGIAGDNLIVCHSHGPAGRTRGVSAGSGDARGSAREWRTRRRRAVFELCRAERLCEPWRRRDVLPRRSRCRGDGSRRRGRSLRRPDDVDCRRPLRRRIREGPRQRRDPPSLRGLGPGRRHRRGIGQGPTDPDSLWLDHRGCPPGGRGDAAAHPPGGLAGGRARGRLCRVGPGRSRLRVGAMRRLPGPVTRRHSGSAPSVKPS